MVGLAKRLEGKPFHLVASHCQNNPKAEVVGYLKQQKLPADAPNFTVTSRGGHPKVAGNGYVPYYMVFDHRGKLVQEHMCGAYHGGDGLKMIEWVDRLLVEAPSLYLGEEPFVQVPKLAARVAAKKKLADAVREIETGLAASPEEARGQELQRLLDAVKRYRDRGLQHAERAMATRPSGVLPALKALQKELKGTRVGAAVDERMAELSSSEELKQSIAAEKSFARVRKGLEKRKGCKSCKRQGIREVVLSCPGCRAANKQAFAKARKKLETLLEANAQLPIAAAIKEYLETLG